MSKIHLEVEIPGNAKTYEFMLDDRMKIGTAKKQIMKQIAELEGHDLFAGLDNIVFGSLELEGLIQDNETFREVGDQKRQPGGHGIKTHHLQAETGGEHGRK